MRHLVPAAAAAAALTLAAAACTDGKTVARADSLQAVATQQVALVTKLAAQKDSLTRVVLDADHLISQVDSQVSRVKGLKVKHPSGPTTFESPIEEQLHARKEMLARVSALVARAQETAKQLAESRRRELALRGKNEKLESANAQLEADLAHEKQVITQLEETIQRQTAQILALQTQVDSLNGAVKTVSTTHYRAYYVVGTEKELLKRGVVAREGGANLLLAHPGRTLQPARTLDPEQFTAIDQREVHEIQVPDSTRRYRLVSRQSLDAAEVAERDKTTFRGNIKITDPDKFWGGSRYLILEAR
ncbi:MAG TPA: hypothetical protein VFJ74_15725 [Gemmatimonadaceae bacterium]|nr:hypothetical protein [Gemmatimonadaceae bacterium]